MSETTDTTVEQAICPACELRLMKADTSDGTLRMSLSDPTGAAQVLAETFAGALDKHGAKNYLEIIFIRPTDGERYVVTVQRPEGKTPHEIRADLESQLTGYRGDLASLESQLTSALRERDALKDTIAEEVGENMRLAQRLGFWHLVEAGESWSSAVVETFDSLLRERDEARASALKHAVACDVACSECLSAALARESSLREALEIAERVLAAAPHPITVAWEFGLKTVRAALASSEPPSLTQEGK